MEVSVQFHAPGRFAPEGKFPGTFWIGGLILPGVGLDAVV